jgi:hypothetical protein
MAGRVQFDLIQEPRGADYAALLQIGLNSCDRFSLVMRAEVRASDEALAVLQHLRFAMIGEYSVSEWPGTTLRSGEATLYQFAFSRAAAFVLSENVDGLYDWAQPSRLEDLTLFRHTGEPWLVSIAHERDGYMMLSSDEHQAISASHPSLAGMLRPQPAAES